MEGNSKIGNIPKFYENIHSIFQNTHIEYKCVFDIFTSKDLKRSPTLITYLVCYGIANKKFQTFIHLLNSGCKD